MKVFSGQFSNQANTFKDSPADIIISIDGLHRRQINKADV
jgi:hypothetical protein